MCAVSEKVMCAFYTYVHVCALNVCDVCALYVCTVCALYVWNGLRCLCIVMIQYTCNDTVLSVIRLCISKAVVVVIVVFGVYKQIMLKGV